MLLGSMQCIWSAVRMVAFGSLSGGQGPVGVTGTPPELEPLADAEPELLLDPEPELELELELELDAPPELMAPPPLELLPLPAATMPTLLNPVGSVQESPNPASSEAAAATKYLNGPLRMVCSTLRGACVVSPCRMRGDIAVAIGQVEIPWRADSRTHSRHCAWAIPIRAYSLYPPRHRKRLHRSQLLSLH
jgi:hypothetical protein